MADPMEVYGIGVYPEPYRQLYKGTSLPQALGPRLLVPGPGPLVLVYPVEGRGLPLKKNSPRDEVGDDSAKDRGLPCLR